MLTALVFQMGSSEPQSHRVANVSASGLCVVHDGSLQANTTVVVTIGQVEHVPADVMWARGGLSGLRFHHAIPVEKARARRTSAAMTAPASGWLVELNDPYKGRRKLNVVVAGGRRTGDPATVAPWSTLR